MTTQTASCRVIVVNDVLGTRTEATSPQTSEEAMKNHGLVRLARDWLGFYHTDDLTVENWVGVQPIACSIHRTADAVIVHWHVVGDPEAARTAMREVLDGTWKEGELL